MTTPSMDRNVQTIICLSRDQYLLLGIIRPRVESVRQAFRCFFYGPDDWYDSLMITKLFAVSRSASCWQF